MNDDRSFWVSEDGSSASPPATAGSWGYDKRTCDACGADWGQMGCTRAGCISISFTTRYVPPVPFFTGLREKLAPKPAPPRASAPLVSDLRGLQSTARQLLDDLRRVDAALIASLRGGVEELALAQSHVHRSLAITGDRAPRNIDGLGLGLEALTDYLGAAINNLSIEDKPK
jgi:hypothetical protein